MAQSSEELADVQNSTDERGVALDQVGVRDLRYPITVLDPEDETQQTVAEVSMSVGLPQEFKGTHMSRFVEVLNQYRGEFTMHTLPGLLQTLQDRLEAKQARIEVQFPYFLERTAPATEKKALMDYECSFVGEVDREDSTFTLGVTVPVTSLCPCSKEISDEGAHNQRGHVDIQVRSVPNEEGDPTMIWIEELVEMAESAASAPLYPLLKRPDERHVTMEAYENPAFVEDITRDMAVQLKEDGRVKWFHLQVENFESIHNHNAFAEVTWEK
ncbi:GTP cyclohydrolase I [Salinibacter ruber]|jgi:GTP cyclohydrolase I|uniref:GTP cyclohydrolase FolE2 n=1 Tax=Salinibacter ruber TaxID=146919 RepID=UPI00216729DC|nr:GTP cyclohydrolase FolE2 [Salinibacter ruber]MCS3668873.1 GTP cyclohydrolase I [Salinibacter ruber]